MKKILISLLLLTTLSTYCMDQDTKLNVQQEAFLQAARDGDIEKLKELLSKDPLLVHTKSIREKRTALHSAVMGYLIHSKVKSFDVFRFLIEHGGANPAITEIDNKNVEQFLEYKLKQSLETLDGISSRAQNLRDVLAGTIKDPVHHVIAILPAEEAFIDKACHGDIDTVQKMFAANNGLLNVKNAREGRTALHAAAMGYVVGGKEVCLPIIKFLISAGADSQQKEKNGKTVSELINHKLEKHGKNFPQWGARSEILFAALSKAA